MATACPQDLRDAWARVFAHAWQADNREFLRRLNKHPRQTISQIANGQRSEKLTEACKTILRYVDDPNSDEGFLALPPLPESLQGDLNEDQLYTYAKQDGLYGLLRVT